MAGLRANETHNHMQKRKKKKSVCKKEYELFFFIISCQHAKLLEKIVSQYVRNKEIISQANGIQLQAACNTNITSL
jgi:hypothetical protein